MRVGWAVVVLFAAAAGGCTRAAAPQGLSPQEGLPEAVARTRGAIYAAASAGDHDALRPLIGSRFIFSFGPDDDPIAHWRMLEQEGLDRPLEIMAAVLRLPYTVVNTGDAVYYVWPFAYNRPIGSLTPEERSMLRTIADDEEIASWTLAGGYIGYRLGIRSDGVWMYFVGGD